MLQLTLLQVFERGWLSIGKALAVPLVVLTAACFQVVRSVVGSSVTA